MGPMGPTGLTGSKGTRGEQGPRGESGLVGAPGMPGLVGAAVRIFSILFEAIPRLFQSYSFVSTRNVLETLHFN